MSIENYGSLQNSFGDSMFLIKEQSTGIERCISFDWKCGTSKRHWAQQLFFEFSNIIHSERGKPIIVKSANEAHNISGRLMKICEYWEKHHSYTPLWSWSEHDVVEFLRQCLFKSNKQIYAKSNFNAFSHILNLSHKSKLSGNVFDGISFSITPKLKQYIATPILSQHGLTFAEWNTGNTIPTIPLGIAAKLLAKAINILESEDNKIADALYTAWRKRPVTVKSWFPAIGTKTDILQRSKSRSHDKYGIIAELDSRGMSISKLPWTSIGGLMDWQDKVVASGMIVIFTQTGHRYAEVLSANSKGCVFTGETARLREILDKTLGGIEVSRPIPKLSAQTVKTLWSYSFVDPQKIPLPLFHRGGRSTLGNKLMEGDHKIINQWRFHYDYKTLSDRLQSFYEEQILSSEPEIRTSHPKLSFHQFRHAFAEFSLRRFDETVHEKLREHFIHHNDRTTRIYEKNKLNKDTRTSLEQAYLFELFGRIKSGSLDATFWGPAFKRLKKELERIKFLPPESANKEIFNLADTIERLAIFEWGYCILFKCSHPEAKCHDPLTGLPNIEGYASPERCTGCPNNMGNQIQKNNLVRIQLLHNELAYTHPIRAIGKLNKDIAEQISRRVGGL